MRWLAVLTLVWAVGGGLTKAAEDEAPAPPGWLADYEFKQDKFTFVRIKYSDSARFGRRWATDFPDADVKFSERLKKLTKLDVDPEGKVLELTDPALSDYPLIYVTEPGSLHLSSKESAALRKYLLGGGFLMLDDFWGEKEWANLASEMARVFPERKFQELPLEHRLFHCVYDLAEKPQVCSIAAALAGRDRGITYERLDGQEAHYRGIVDERGRLLVLACHNTDLADGWERGDADDFYRREFSEKRAFPMGVNIVFYALTR